MKKFLVFIFGLLTLLSVVTMYGGFIGIPITILGFIISLFTSLSVPFWAPFASLGVALAGMGCSALFAGLAVAAGE